MSETPGEFATSGRSTKHSARLDDEMQHEVQGEGAVRPVDARQEWTDPEPAAEGEPDVDVAPDGTLVGGTPVGMDADAVVARNELARWLDRADFPSTGPQPLRPRATTARRTPSSRSWSDSRAVRPTSASATSSALGYPTET